MKIGLMTAIREDIHLPVESYFKRISTNLAPMYLAGYLEKLGLPVEIFIKDRLEDFEAIRPDVFGVSAITENIEFARSCAAAAKSKWNSATVLGGVHLTSLPGSLPPEFDVGVVGEGEASFADLISLWLDKQSWQAPDLERISGLVFHGGEGVRKTGFRKGLDPLDLVPFPARHKYIKNAGITYMMTSRGCPYTCSFCTIPFTSEGYRVTSPNYVVREIEDIHLHYPQVKHIRIFDDLYVVQKKRVREIAEQVNAAGLSQELSFSCWGRANLLDDAMVETFHKMNITHVAFGAESGSSRIISQIKPGSSVEQNQQAIDTLSKNGIKVACSVILGHPLEQEADIWATYEFIEKNFDKIHDIEFNVAIPWPGTDLWQRALANGKVSPDMNFSSLKEVGFFPNYCTDYYPYLNLDIPPDRFDEMMGKFKRLFWKFFNRNQRSMDVRNFAENGEIAKLQ